MTRYFLFVVLFSLGAGTCTAQDETSKGDLKKIQGKWKVASCIYDGKEIDAEAGNGWTFEKNKLSVEKAAVEMTITLNAAKQPKEMELKVGNAPHTVKGIYALEGQTLKVCYGTKEDDKRPEKFESTAGSGRLLITLKCQAEKQEELFIAYRLDDTDLLKKEIELLKKEIELLKKENEDLKKENDGLKKSGSPAKKGPAREKDADDGKETVSKVTLDNVEYVYQGSVRNGNAVIVNVLATSKDGNRPVPRGQMTLIDENGEKYTGNLVGGTNTSRHELREGVPQRLQWQFGGRRPFTGDLAPQGPSAKVKRFAAVIIELGHGARNNSIEFRNVRP